LTLEQHGDTPQLISIVVPARNEEGNVARLRDELERVIVASPYRFEVLLIDNDSGDRTGDLVKEICRSDTRWKYLRLSRDFGVEASISAGYRHAAGAAVIVIYSDLQDPPDLIPEFLAKWEEGFDVVYGVQRARLGEPRLKSWLVRRVYRLLSRASERFIRPDASDYRLVSQELATIVAELPERSRNLRGLISWLGFRQIGIPYLRQPRTAGQSKSSLGFLIRFVIDGATGFSLRPLRLAGVAAAVLCAAAAIWGIAIVVAVIAGDTLSTTALLGLLIVAIGALNAVSLWLVSEYVGRIHLESRRRPLYVVAEALNVEPIQAAPG
jgi:polyisoprenyl-phosphate glycosyltransferase